MKKELDKELYPDYVYPEFTPDPNEPFREPIAKLGKKITDRIPQKLGLKKITRNDPEYWGLAGVLTDEEAELAVKLGVRKPKTLAEIVKLSGLEEKKCEALLEEMSRKGLLEYNWENPKHEKQYVLPMYVPGCAEFFNMNANILDSNPEMGTFFEHMSRLPLEKITPFVPEGGAGIGMHVIPVEKAIEMENESVDLEHISHWLNKYEGKYAASPCSCRRSRLTHGEGCADDPEGWCIAIGDMADYVVETQKDGRYIDKAEALEILKAAEDNGFVHQITNIDGANKIFAICNCNVNVCYALRTSQLFNTPNMSRSAYVAKVEKANCVACGKCVEFCPAGAVKLGQKLCDKEGCEVTYPRIPLPSEQPWGEHLIQIQRGLTTSSTAIFVPFTVQELFQSGEALYYGLNALSNNMILCDRKRLKNPNGLILGTPGSGKSFSAKREITNAFLITADDIIICDPEAEYYPLVERLKGQVIKVSQNSTQYINPMDINLNYSEGDTPIALKSDFILSFCELIMGGKNGLEAVEKTLIDRAVISVYRSYLADPKPENMPILGDLYNEIKKQPEKEAQRIASALELYVNGSLNVFNHQTNVDIHNRLVCFDIKELGTQLRKLGMLIVQDQVWNRVTINRSEGKATRYYIDEFHLLLKEEQTAAYSVEIWKRFRKWGGIPTGITQNVKDLLSSREVENIFENSDFVYMLNQAQGDREILAKQLNISQQQMTYVTHSDAGEGLIFYGNVILPFIDRFPQDTELYRVMTTKPGEVSA